MTRPTRIPVLDFADLAGSGPRRASFVRALGEGLEAFGFVSVVGAGLDAALLDEAYQAARAVFALPEAVKRGYERPQIARQRGYTPFRQERAKDQSAADLKEFWHVGRELPADRDPGLIPRNVFPVEVPEFEWAMRTLFVAQERFALALLEAIADYLGRPSDALLNLAAAGNSVLRVINYPDVGGAPPVGAVRAAAHEDINLLTVLPAATRPGLEILTPEGAWLDVDPPPDAMVCDTGDMMARITGGRLPATTHRVVNPEGADGGRMSMPFFLHPHPEAMLVPFAGDAPPIRAHDYLMDRLAANKVTA